MQNILWDYGGGVWDKDGKPALGTSFLKENTAALQFAVDTIQKHKIQPPGVIGWTDVPKRGRHGGKLVTTNNGASLYFAMVEPEARAGVQDACSSDAGWSRRPFDGASCYNWRSTRTASGRQWRRTSSAGSRTRSASPSTWSVGR